MTKQSQFAILAGIVIAAVGAYLYFYKKENGISYKLGYLWIRKSDEEFVVHLGLPRPPEGSINAGDRITIKKAGPYNMTFIAKGIWIDAKGNIGAIYTGIYDMKLKNITETTDTGFSDRSYQGKGKIIVE